jgi:membrane protein
MEFGQLGRAFSAFRRDHASRFGAALAFYIALSIAPVAVIAIAATGMIFGRHAAENVIFHQIAGSLGAAQESAVEEIVRSAARLRIGLVATALSLVTLAFGLLGIYTQVEDALNTIWNRSKREHPRAIDRIRAAAVVLGVGLLLFVIVAADAAIAITGKYASHHLFGGVAVWQAIQLSVSAMVLTLLFTILFRRIPGRKASWRDAFPPAAFTALLFVIGKFALGLYLSEAAVGSSYGAAGSLVVVLLWAYWSAQIFFFGLEFTHVYATR